MEKYDFTYYFRDVMHHQLTDTTEDTSKNIFIPAASLYQVGREYEANDESIVSSSTQKPYVIEKNKVQTMDFDKTFYLPSRFTYEIKSYSEPDNGTLTKSGNVFSYTPSSESSSGLFDVTLTLKDSQNVYADQDITLDFEFTTDPAGSFMDFDRLYSPYQKTYDAPTTIGSFSKGSVVSSTNFEPWDDTRKIDFICDGDLNTASHTKSGLYVASNPAAVTVKLDEEISANQMTIYAYSSGRQKPMDFTLEVSKDGENFTKVADVTNAVYSNNQSVVKFAHSTFQYYRFRVTKSNENYVAMQELVFGQTFEGKEISPDDSSISYQGGWQYKNDVYTTFGHYLEADTGNVTIDFESTGIVLNALKNQGYGSYQITLDGVDMGTYSLDGVGSIDTLATFLGLEEGDHSLVLKGQGKVSFTSAYIQ